MPTLVLRRWLAAISLLACAAGCGDDLPPGVEAAIERFSNVVTVWRCDVPVSSTSDWFAESNFRLHDSPEDLARRIAPAAAWFDRQSGGLFVPQFEAGGVVALADGEGPEVCVAAAEKSVRETNDAPVLVVGTAEHRGERPGGWGRPGVAYVGAADFHPDWGERPPLDLVEHELGHALGWTHSGVGGELNSALDAMSDSAAPRAIDPQRRDAPGVLLAHLREVGWIADSDSGEFDAAGGSILLRAWSGVSAERRSSANVDDGQDPVDSVDATDPSVGWPVLLVVLDAGNGALPLTVEVKTDSGDDDHLERSGVIIHRVEADGDLTPLVGTAPFLRPLGDGDEWSGAGWTVSVAEGGPPDGQELWLVSCRFDGRLRSD
jgi:hypothetical protein